MSDKMKKLKCEMLEIDLRRQELNKSVLEADDELAQSEIRQASKTGGRKSSRSWLTNMVSFKTEPIEIKNEKLNELLSECDERMVELSNIFLSEKIELIYRHNKEIAQLNRQVNALSRQLVRFGVSAATTNQEDIFMFDSHAQTDLTSLDFNDDFDHVLRNQQSFKKSKSSRFLSFKF